jgi:hypothetical protein
MFFALCLACSFLVLSACGDMKKKEEGSREEVELNLDSQIPIIKKGQELTLYTIIRCGYEFNHSLVNIKKFMVNRMNKRKPRSKRIYGNQYFLNLKEATKNIKTR